MDGLTVELAPHSSLSQTKPKPKAVGQGTQSKFSSLIETLNACSKSKDLKTGKKAHADAVKHGLDSNIYITSKLINMYARCGSLVDARRTFDKLQLRNVVSWTALMLGYVDTGEEQEVLRLYVRMLADGCTPNARTFVVILKACAGLATREKWSEVSGSLVKLKSLEKGMALHCKARLIGCDSDDIFVANTLVDMYARCGSMSDAYRVFTRMRRCDVVSWNSLILGYAENKKESLALSCFARMQVDEACEPNGRTFVAVLKACITLAAAEDGKAIDGKRTKLRSLETIMAIHSQAVKTGYIFDVFIQNTLIDAYAKSGSLDDARNIFDRGPRSDLVTWNSMILGLAENGEAESSLDLFFQMRLKPDAPTFVAALKACGCVLSLGLCKAVHASISRSGYETNAVLANCLTDVYGKCGSLLDAQLVFETLDTKDTVSWNSLIAGYSRQGDTQKVLALLHAMVAEGLPANGITFVHMLSACSHAGAVKIGSSYLKAMGSKFGVKPATQHYNCLIDGLGRANEVAAAIEVVQETTPCESTPLPWKTVLGAYQKWSNVCEGMRALESVLDFDGDDPAAYELAASLVAKGGQILR